MDAKKAHIEMLANGRWAIFNPDGSRFDGNTYASREAARRALNLMRTACVGPL